MPEEDEEERISRSASINSRESSVDLNNDDSGTTDDEVVFFKNMN